MNDDLGRCVHWLAIGAIVIAAAVLLGAFGAHGLKETLSVAHLSAYQTAVQYQFYHGIGIMVVATLALNLSQFGLETKGLYRAIKWLFLGILLFSGSLYAMTLLGARWLGMVTPLGGVIFVVGWLSLAVTLFKHRYKKQS